MSNKTDNTGFSRRAFVKALGLAAAGAATGAAAPALAAPAPEQPAAGKAQAMPKRKLGKTGVEVSVLNLGGMFDTINNQLLLKQALNWGVNYWDTAEAYGNGLSEEGFGRFFTRNPDARKDVFLVTKLVPKGGNFTERLDKALERLHTNYVDLFFVHGVASVEEAEAHKQWAADMKKAGKIKFFGFSTHTNMEDCLLAAAGKDWVDAVMFSYNFRLMQTDKMRAAVDACYKAGIGLVAMKTQGGGPVKTDSEAELKMAGQFMNRGFTDKQAKLKAVWENPQIASICSQMHTLTILSANVAAARDQTTLAAGEMNAMVQYALETKGDYCAGCGSICQEAVGGAVPVNDVMRCLMYHREYGEPELARATFAGLPEEARTLLTEVDYTKAEKACPQGLAIAELMELASRTFA